MHDGVHDYEELATLGTGASGTVKLMRHSDSGEVVAVRFIEKGSKVTKQVEREVLNHRSLLHPHVLQFREVFVTPTHLGVVTEYAREGDLRALLDKRRRLTEGKARFLLQQLVSAIAYCHCEGVCHRELNLESALLHRRDARSALQIKVCEFGLSRAALLDSMPLPPHAPLQPPLSASKPYEGAAADVFTCGVLLYRLLVCTSRTQTESQSTASEVGRHPFTETVRDKFENKGPSQRPAGCFISVPASLRVSADCVNLLEQMLKADPADRITLGRIREHPWFLTSLPIELQDGGLAFRTAMQVSQQSMHEVRAVLQQARAPPKPPPALSGQSAATAAAAVPVSNGR